MKNNKKLVLAVVALVAVAAIALGLWFALKPQGTQGEKNITVNVVFADGTQNSHAISTSEEYLRGALEHLDGFLGIARAVVHAEEDVAVQIRHVAGSPLSASRGACAPRPRRWSP